MSALEHVHTITPAEANDAMTEREMVILDVRSPQEYNSAHIKGAINLPEEKVDRSAMLELAQDLDQDILVYCHSGVRSASICSKLEEYGYTRIYDMSAGIVRWTFGLVS